MIRAEMKNLLKWDIEGTQPAEKFTVAELEEASKLIDLEGSKTCPYDEDDYMPRAINMTSGRLLPWNGKIVPIETISRKDRGKAVKNELEVCFLCNSP